MVSCSPSFLVVNSILQILYCCPAGYNLREISTRDLQTRLANCTWRNVLFVPHQPYEDLPYIKNKKYLQCELCYLTSASKKFELCTESTIQNFRQTVCRRVSNTSLRRCIECIPLFKKLIYYYTRKWKRLFDQSGSSCLIIFFCEFMPFLVQANCPPICYNSFETYL